MLLYIKRAKRDYRQCFYTLHCSMAQGPSYLMMASTISCCNSSDKPSLPFHQVCITTPPPSLFPFLCILALPEFFISGGAAVVYCEDAARGHILAEHLGEIGGRYILSEGYYTLEEIFQMACNVLGIKAVRPSRLPSWAALAFSVAGETWASNVTGRAPPLPQGQLRLLESAITPSSFADRSHTESQHPARASEFLGWMPLSFGEGMQATYEFFVFSNLVNPHRS